MKQKNPESGYALLLVYAMAAAVAIMLYTQLPRVAFEAQREKEQLLVDRGEQYTRAVQLYVRKFNRFPADMAALENTQNIRFLRRQYADPMTGKNEWRLIHVGPGGVFTDSLVHKPKKEQAAPQTFITELQPVGGNQTGGQEGVNLANRRRPSDQPGAPGTEPGATGQPNPTNGQPGQPGQPSQAGQTNPFGQTNPLGQPGQVGQPPTVPITGPVMVLPDGRIVPASTTGYPPAITGQPGGITGQPGGITSQPGGITGQPGANGQPGIPTRAGVPGQQGVPIQPGIPGQPPAQFFPPGQGGQFGQQPSGLPPGFQQQPNGGPPPAAANLINQILTTPRPGGLNGLGQPSADTSGNPAPSGGGFGSAPSGATGNNTGTPAGQSLGGTTIGGGVAGVASKLEQEGIKVYNERSAYNEWEFVYDMTKDPMRAGVQNPGQNPGGRGGTQPSAPVPAGTPGLPPPIGTSK